MAAGKPVGAASSSVAAAACEECLCFSYSGHAQLCSCLPLTTTGHHSCWLHRCSVAHVGDVCVCVEFERIGCCFIRSFACDMGSAVDRSVSDVFMHTHIAFALLLWMAALAGEDMGWPPCHHVKQRCLVYRLVHMTTFLTHFFSP